jgi:hypothetical protein
MLACVLLGALLFAQTAPVPPDEEGPAYPDPLDYIPRNPAAVDVTGIDVPIRSYRTRATAAVQMFYLAVTDEAMITYQCRSNVFDIGDAQMACEDYANDFLKKHQSDAFLGKGEPRALKPYYHFRVLRKSDIMHFTDPDPRQQETRYQIYIQFYS